MFNLRDYLCELLGCNADCSECQSALAQCQKQKGNIQFHYEQSQERIRQLELLIPRPLPPIRDHVVEKDTAWVQSVLMGLGAEIIRLPLGGEFCLTDKDTFIDFIAWDWVDSFEYHKFYRCGNFAISFKASADQWGVNQVGIVLDYKSSHAYNIVVFPDGKVMLLEPQSDNLFYWQEHAPQFYPLQGAVVII
jgi:hypothetical protein